MYFSGTFHSAASCSRSAALPRRRRRRLPREHVVAAADVEAQTEQALRNIATILTAAGSGLEHVIRCGVFLVDMKEFPKMNEVYARAFGTHRPARTTVEVSGLPGDGLRVEIDAVAVIP